MNILEQKLAAKYLFPKRAWLDGMFTKGVTSETQAFTKLMQEDFRKVIDQSRLQRLNFTNEIRLAKLEKPLAVQILHAINVGVSKRDLAEEGEIVEGEEDQDKKFDTKYFDPSLMKEKKKQNKDAHRMMKLSLTDGLNEIEAIEYERFKNMDHFSVG